jgi:hypothetical protein
MRFPAKHALGLDPGVDTGSREENASKQEIEPRSDSIGTGKGSRLPPIWGLGGFRQTLN